ncbi:MAG: YceI family protein [Pontiella sp.]
MNKALITLLGTSLTLGVIAETFTIDTGHAEIGFSAKHMMVSNTKGTFNTFEGTFDYDMASKTLNSAEGIIEAGSIDTNNEKRDAHLKNADFFNVAQFPKMTFKSTSVKKTGDNVFEVTGNLNVLGVDRKVVLPVSISGPIDGRHGGMIIGVESITTLNRRDLGIDHSPSSVIGDNIKISIELEASFK